MSDKATALPSLKNWGGVRRIQQKIKRSQTLADNREAVAYSLLSMANTNLTDIVEWDANGAVKVKASDAIPETAKAAIKRIRVTKDGEIDIELYDKVGVLRLLAKASGMLDQEHQDDKPSVIGININPPIDVDAKT